MSSKADYLKKYLSNPDDDKKKKKKKSKSTNSKPTGLRLIEDDAFLSVEAAKQKDIASDEEREEIEVIRDSVKKAKVIKGFKSTFAEVKTEVKEEPVSPSNSPPRVKRKRHDSDNSPDRGRVEESSKFSPKRKRHDSDNSPPRRKRHDSDNSPPRRKRHDSDNSPPRRKRHDSDNSPPRRNRHDSDNSPPRRKRHDSDNSPPRRNRYDSGNSPPRRKRHDSDNSPPRRNRHDSDNSPPRRRVKEEDLSPPRGRRRHDSDNSPPRRGRNDSRKYNRHEKENHQKVVNGKLIKEEIDSDAEEHGSSRLTMDKKRSGLQSAKELKAESDRLRRKDEKMFNEMDASISGRDAETVYRKKQTKKRGRDTSEERAKKEREAKKTEELKEKYKDWNKGVHQIKSRMEQLEEMARVASQPFTRTAEDVDMNDHLKDVLLKDDPMANLIKKKRVEVAIDRGELVYPTYQGHWEPNRFNIAPGYRWDGVDRSNGFEGKLARRANQKDANQTEYYKAMAEYE